jgi:VWFA-related protein
MSTVAGKCAASVGPYRRVACWCGVLAFSTALVFAAQLIEQPCQAQAAPGQNAPPPEAPSDPPPSLVKHPKPAPAPAPAQSNSAPAAQPGSTTTPAEQAPQVRSGSTQGSAAQSSSSAVPSAAQNPAAVESSGPPQTTSAASPTASGNTSTSATQSPTGVQASTGAQPTAVPSPEPQPAAAASAAPAPAPAASSPDATSAASAASAPEINTRTSTVPLESHANLVPVRVVVHDSTGHAVENLQKDDFQVRQDGKLQFITHFSVETPGSAEKQVARGEAIALPTDPTSYSLTDSTAGDAGKSGPGSLAMPSRFVALLFDDAHLEVGDLTRSKLAALRFIDSSVKPNQRLAVFTVSGHNQVDFTDDHAKIRDAITHMIAMPVGAYDPRSQQDCPQITYYQADLIQNKNDPQALGAAIADAVACLEAKGATPAQAQLDAPGTVTSTVAIVLSAGEINTQYVVRRLTEVVRRVSALPGQRSIVLVSPGFLTSTYEYEVSEVIDKANHANIFINTLDGRGLYTVDPLGDITQPVAVRANSATAGLSLQYRITEQQVQSEVLADLAYGTGGFYFRNNNDLDVGFRTTAAEPEVSYLLAFVPSNLKNDGKFHSISVKLTTKEKYTVQARRGFFAPKRGETPEQLAKQDIEDALFSQEEQQSLPIQLHLQYFKSDVNNAKLSVLAHVDLMHVGFEKSEGRNWDDLTIVAALFDRDGNFITGEEKTLELRLKDSTLARLDQTGVTVKTNFDVKPGGYLVRLVVRDTKAAQLSARNGVVEIP